MLKELPFRDHQDSYLDMVARRHINEDFAEEPVEFNEQGLRLVSKYVELGKDKAILDIGCSSGMFVLKAVRATGTEAHIYGLEPDAEVVNFLPPNIDDGRFTFLQGLGEDIPLPDNTVSVTTAHNVLFRAQSKGKMLEEMKRVTKPGGFLVISTNARYHAFWRHTFERVVARQMADKTGQEIKAPSIPAAGCYLEDLPDITEQAGQLQIVDKLSQFCGATITRDRVNDYIRPIALSCNRTNLRSEDRSQWREVTQDVVEPFVLNRIEKMEARNEERGIGVEPYFADVVWRGVIVAKNLKT